MPVYCRLLATAAIAVSSLAVALPAQADSGKFIRADGFELTIRCRDWGCSVLGKPPGGSWSLVEKGPGGPLFYDKLVGKYAEVGFVLKPS
ncbi:MAG: hypothetical protein AAFY25_12265 [Pseudomonadota bacterium]